MGGWWVAVVCEVTGLMSGGWDAVGMRWDEDAVGMWDEMGWRCCGAVGLLGCCGMGM